VFGCFGCSIFFSTKKIGGNGLTYYEVATKSQVVPPGLLPPFLHFTPLFCFRRIFHLPSFFSTSYVSHFCIRFLPCSVSLFGVGFQATLQAPFITCFCSTHSLRSHLCSRHDFEYTSYPVILKCLDVSFGGIEDSLSLPQPLPPSNKPNFPRCL